MPSITDNNENTGVGSSTGENRSNGNGNNESNGNNMNGSNSNDSSNGNGTENNIRGNRENNRENRSNGNNTNGGNVSGSSNRNGSGNYRTSSCELSDEAIREALLESGTTSREIDDAVILGLRAQIDRIPVPLVAQRGYRRRDAEEAKSRRG